MEIYQCYFANSEWWEQAQTPPTQDDNGQFTHPTLNLASFTGGPWIRPKIRIRDYRAMVFGEEIPNTFMRDVIRQYMAEHDIDSTLIHIGKTYRLPLSFEDEIECVRMRLTQHNFEQVRMTPADEDQDEFHRNGDAVRITREDGAPEKVIVDQQDKEPFTAFTFG